MKALIVTTLYPGTLGKDVQGAYRRLGMHIGALAKVADQLEIIYFVYPTCPQLELTQERLNQEQSEYWGTPVRVSLAPNRPYSKRRWWHRLLAVTSYSLRADAFPFGGDEQTKALEQCFDRRPDIVFVHKLPSMLPVFGLRRELPHLIFDLDDVEHRVKIRSALANRSWLSKVAGLLKVPSIFLAERKAARLSAKLFVCSDHDRRYLQRLGFGEKVAIASNAISIPKRHFPLQKEQTILFLGVLAYQPNAEAAERLITGIWPHIRRECPSAKLIIAGASPQSLPSYRLAPKNVEFPGLVDDLDLLYGRSRLICCPLMNGGGTRIKLIEAAGYAKPIVSTAIGAEGLVFTDGSDIFIRNDDVGIAEACVRLLKSDDLCVRLGDAARNKAQSMYDAPLVRDRIALEILSSLGSPVKATHSVFST